ncbi:MAG: zinc ribbon domain-containing protein [Eubacteriaceae bacterium]|nr:zinc ribbon domain-containing protein [Eubacteriaceae bacterium]
MAKDFFEGLGELGKGIGKMITEGVEKVTEKAEEFIGKDEYDAEIKEIKKEMTENEKLSASLYEKIGRYAVETQGTELFGEDGKALAEIIDKNRELQIRLDATILAQQSAKIVREANENPGYGFDVCLKCGAELKENAKFCRECGQMVQPLDMDIEFVDAEPQMKKCPVCGDEDPVSAKFCSECGHKYE